MHLYSEYNKGIIRTGKTIAQMNNKQVKIKKKIYIYINRLVRPLIRLFFFFFEYLLFI